MEGSSQWKTLKVTKLFTTAQRWKKPKCLPSDEWINKMWHICIMVYYSALKKKEILTHATTQMNLENIILSEKARHKRTNIV